MYIHQVNHDEFEYTIQVTAKKEVKAAFRIFIAPQHDEHGHEMDLDIQRRLFIEMDKFVQTGKLYGLTHEGRNLPALLQKS